MYQALLTKEKSIHTPKNNDPLAHVRLLQESYDSAVAYHRMRVEFITDMGERLEDQPFMSQYSYTYDDSEITYDTGLQYMKSLQLSYEAAKHDVARGGFDVYHEERQKAFLQQGELLLDWLQQPSNDTYLLLISPCPPEEELNPNEARRQSFKQKRMMASLQLHAKNSLGQGQTIAFSLDGLTLERLNELLDTLNIHADVASSSLEQVTIPILVTADSTPSETASAIVEEYDSLRNHENPSAVYQQGVDTNKSVTEANSFVEKHPEAFDLYRTIIEEVAVSMQVGVTRRLKQTIDDYLVRQYKEKAVPRFLKIDVGQTLTESIGSAMIDYLRKQAIPEYLTQKLHSSNEPQMVNDTHGSYDIGSAGATAMSEGREYDSACASSSNAASVNPAIHSGTQRRELGLMNKAAYETPKPIFSKGAYDVIPIGACPVCGNECGVGIRNKKSGKWYCTRTNCSAFKQDIYAYVFDTDKSLKETKLSSAKQENLAEAKQNHYVSAKRKDIRTQIQLNQYAIWTLKNTMYESGVSPNERTEMIKELISLYQTQGQLVRSALGLAANTTTS
ncbi:hypothetical protein H6795_04065 [Candidatus Nomurabacteria bacterium]|nr:hypothetical protein [Candidatus Nomurabacteria bacterium]